MSGNVIQAPFYKSGFYNTGVKSGWQNSVATINGHEYQTIKKDGIEWMAQNLDEVFPGLTLSDTSDAYQPTWVYRAGGILTEYDNGSINQLIGVSYKGRARDIIISFVGADGWRIPSTSDWSKLINSLDDPHDLCHPICKCDYSLHLGTNKTGMSIVTCECGGNTDNGKPSTLAFFMTNNVPPGKNRDYQVTARFHNAEFAAWDNNTGSATWYNLAQCRLVRNY